MNGAAMIGRAAGAVVALLLAAQSPMALAQSDPVARALSARALADARTDKQIDRLRRAAQRAAAANPEDAELASGVTMSVSATPDAALTTVYNAGPSAALFATSGGRPTAAGGAANSQFLYFPVASVAPATNGNLSAVLATTPDYAAWGWSAAFDTDSDRVEIRLSSCATCLFRVHVDGRYIARAGTPGVNYVAHVLLDFAGVRRPRTIMVEASDTNALRVVAVRPTSNIWRPGSDPDRIVAIATGDSYSEGQGASSPGLFGWPKTLGRLLGWTDVRQVAVGGTGYLSWGGALNRSRIASQIGRWLTVNDDLTREDVDIVTVAAGYNDHGAVGGTIYPPEDIAAQALADWRAIRALLPRATIMVMGPHAGARGPDGRTQAIETALQARFAQWRDSNALFVPVAGTGGATPWIFGTGRVGAPTGTGNADVAISSDSVHPSDAGHMLYARRAAAAIRAELSRRAR